MASSLASLTPEHPLNTMDVSLLAEYCTNELHKHRRGEASEDAYGLELFRRIRLYSNEDAWNAFQQCFTETALLWLYHHPKREMAMRIDSAENYVALAFERFWIATIRNKKIEFSTLSAALSYLHASLNAAICDSVRAQIRRKEISLPEPGSPGEPFVEDEMESEELLHILQEMFSRKREQRLIYLLYHCGLKPREIIRECPQEFSDIHEIYRLQHSIVDRLSRNSDQFRWRLSLSTGN